MGGEGLSARREGARFGCLLARARRACRVAHREAKLLGKLRLKKSHALGARLSRRPNSPLLASALT
eukprot:2429261-Pleurochrysis_carterae.AAC.1